jgi:RNA polymerase sigma factor (TIGR02999 family)
MSDFLVPASTFATDARARSRRSAANADGSSGADHQITRLLDQLKEGEEGAFDRLMPVVYAELRSIAHRQLRHQHPGHTLNTTALVHEAYVKLVDQTQVDWADRAHFYGVAARAMRQILVNHAAKHGTLKRGGGWRRVPFDERVLGSEEQADLLLALDEALSGLESFSGRLSRVVEYRFFGGMTEEEVATALGMSVRTIRRDWMKAKLWLYTELAEDDLG